VHTPIEIERDTARCSAPVHLVSNGPLHFALFSRAKLSAPFVLQPHLSKFRSYTLYPSLFMTIHYKIHTYFTIYTCFSLMTFHLISHVIFPKMTFISTNKSTGCDLTINLTFVFIFFPNVKNLFYSPKLTKTSNPISEFYANLRNQTGQHILPKIH
jgi:hypothetical protein